MAPKYAIQAAMKPGQIMYLQIDMDTPSINFTSKQQATVFESQSLVNGWLLKAKSLYMGYKFTVVSV